MNTSANSAPPPTSATPRQKNPKGRGELLHAELIAAAARIIERDGHEALTLRAVAREAQVTAPAIYAHFADLRSLMAELHHQTWQHLGAHMRAADRRAADLDPLSRVEAQLAAYVEFATSSPSRYEFLFAHAAEPGPTEARPRPLQAVYDTLTDAVQRCREAGYQMPLPAGDDPDPSTVLLFVIAHGRIAVSSASLNEAFRTPAESMSFISASLRVLVTPPD